MYLFKLFVNFRPLFLNCFPPPFTPEVLKSSMNCPRVYGALHFGSLFRFKSKSSVNQESLPSEGEFMLFYNVLVALVSFL